MTSVNRRDFRPFIPECNKRGIGKNTAYNLANDGLLDTFLIGRKRYVYLDSLETLGERLVQATGACQCTDGGLDRSGATQDEDPGRNEMALPPGGGV